MKLIGSIKQQLLLMFVSVTLILSSLYFAVAIVAAFFVEDTMLSRLLKMEANYIEQVFAQSGQLPESRLGFAQVHPGKGSLPVFIQRGIERGSEDNEIFTPDDAHYHYQAIDLGGNEPGYLIAEVSPLLVVTTTPNIVWGFSLGFIIALVISLLLAFKMAAWTVKPVLALTQAVQQNQPMPRLKYELGFLSKTLQSAFDNLAKTLQRERDFTTDVNHELRTPLTILSNTLTLAEQRGVQSGDLAVLKEVSNQMEHTVAILLALARAESLEKQPCDLKARIELMTLQCVQASGTEFELALDIADSFTVTANPGLVDLLLTNLINNAISHASNKQLSISVRNGVLQFKNASEEQALQNITSRGVKGQDSKGIGQGLYLVTRILESLEWDYQIQQHQQTFAIQISL